MIEQFTSMVEFWVKAILGSAICLALIWLAWLSWNFRKQKEISERLKRIEDKLENATVVIK